MDMFARLKPYLSHPLGRNLDLDSPATTDLRKRIISEKPFLRKIYENWYCRILDVFPENRRAPVLELGSGAGFFKDLFQGVIASDLLQIKDVDLYLDGQALPFKKGVLEGIVMIDVFHHLPDVKVFMRNATRCVQPGGMLVMIEPWITNWSGWVYARMHHEPCQPESQTWELAPGGPLSQANLALPWIVFSRDRDIFRQNFPQWHLQEVQLHTPFCYLLSGGVSLRSLMPGFLFGAWSKIEKLLDPWMHRWAMFATIVLVRKTD